MVAGLQATGGGGAACPLTNKRAPQGVSGFGYDPAGIATRSP